MSARVTWGLCFGLIALAWAVSAWVYPGLPATVPTHWNYRGEVDGHGPRWVGAFLMPTILIGLLVMFRVLPVLSPHQFSIDRFEETYRAITVLTVGLLTYLHLVILAATAGWQLPLSNLLMAGVFGFLGLMGGFLGRVRRNFFIGIRVPWTLASERVWDDTHRLASKLWMVGGAAGAILAGCGQVPVAFGVLAVMVAVPIVYSFRLSKRLEASGQI